VAFDHLADAYTNHANLLSSADTEPLNMVSDLVLGALGIRRSPGRCNRSICCTQAVSAQAAFALLQIYQTRPPDYAVVFDIDLVLAWSSHAGCQR
jgi:hypothetical protein